MDSEDFLSNYLPDFDVEGLREKLQVNSKEDLIEMLIQCYKMKRVTAMQAELFSNKLNRIEKILNEPNIIPSIDRPPSNF